MRILNTCCWLLLSTAASFATLVPSDKDSVRSLDGLWRFKLEQAKDLRRWSKGDMAGKVAPDYPQHFEPFYKPEYSETNGWHDLKVPGNWEMAGFSPATYNQPDNASGFYRLWFKVPKSWSGKIVKINFDGVQNGAEIWLNGQPVKVDEPSWGRENYHEGGWTAFQADLTPAIQFGQKNLLALRVTKNTQSVDLDTGDYFFLGGIHRSGTLFCVPQTHLEDLTIQTRLLGADEAEVRLMAKVLGQAATLAASLDQGPKTSAAVTNGIADLRFTVTNAALWSAEFPNLHNLSVDLLDEHKKAIDHITQRMGIREVGITNGVLLLNGVPVKLAGMCRHEVYATEGSALSPDVWRKDLLLMKAANINAIRTSHYPYGSGFYDLCDELGMYVMDELPYCWTTTKDKALQPAFLQRARETLRRDKNHPCVLVWAIDNECREGQNLQAVADLVKALDHTRPRAVSMMDWEKYHTELSDVHYDQGVEGTKFTPVTMDQAIQRARTSGHPCLYLENPNTWDVRLGADPGCWDAWAAVLQRRWDVFAREDVLPGNFIWEWQDRAVADASPTKLYYFFPETGINLLKIKGVVDAFRNPRPWYYDIKMIYSPIQVQSNLTVWPNREASFEVENRYSFTDLSQLNTKWQLLSEEKVIASGSAHPNIAPRTKGTITVQLPSAMAKATALRVNFEDLHGANIISHQFALRESPQRQLSPNLPESLLFPRFNLITRVMKPEPGLWKIAARSTHQLANLRFSPSAGTFLTPALRPGMALDAEIVKEGEPGKSLGRVHCDFHDNRFSYRLQWSGPKEDVQELGWLFAMSGQYDRFSWKHQTRWTVYPETHIGRPTGTARPDSMNVALTKITRPDAFDFNSTKYECDWAALTDRKDAGLMVRFDPAQRHQCRAGKDADGYTLAVNKQVCPPQDISSKVVPDFYLALNSGDVIEASFTVGSVR